MNGVVPTLQQRFPTWQFTQDLHVAPQELEEFTGRQIVPTPDDLRGDRLHFAEVVIHPSLTDSTSRSLESVSTATTVRLQRAEDDLRRERAGRAVDRAARLAAETQAAQEAAAKEAALAEVERLKALLAGRA